MTTYQVQSRTGIYVDRRDAGQRLAMALVRLAPEHPVVLGLPRGGIPVAHEIALALGTDLDVLVVRKIGAPGNPEFAIGAIGEDGSLVRSESDIRALGIDDKQLAATISREQAEIARRVQWYREGRIMTPVAGRSVVLVDDGLATGSTAAAGVQVLRHLGARRVVVAVPTGSPQAVARLQQLADEVVCLSIPGDFGSVGEHYLDFSQVNDEEVIRLLNQAHAPYDQQVRIAIEPPIVLPGHCTIPRGAIGIVVFAHGSGSSRHSPRNQAVARYLNDHGLGTLLLDLLTEGESADRRKVFDIELLATRLSKARGWLAAQPRSHRLAVGYFGASTGAAAALVAAAKEPASIAAVVSRGGRPDLAGSALASVRSPTLLIVGGQDVEVLELNRLAQSRLRCTNELSIVPGATHLFEEPGTLKEAAEQACAWFTAYLSPGVLGIRAAS
jgi:putative phosphoribosyl transferase